MKRSLVLLAAFFVVGGCAHLIFPETYTAIMPPWLPYPLALVYISGACEIAGGVGVLFESTRRTAGYGLIALSVAVFPANIQMLIDAHQRSAAGLWQLALALRLPLQFVIVYWIWTTSVARRGNSTLA